jgi:hypothetical protein
MKTVIIYLIDFDIILYKCIFRMNNIIRNIQAPYYGSGRIEGSRKSNIPIENSKNSANA